MISYFIFNHVFYLFHLYMITLTTTDSTVLKYDINIAKK